MAIGDVIPDVEEEMAGSWELIDSLPTLQASPQQVSQKKSKENSILKLTSGLYIHLNTRTYRHGHTQKRNRPNNQATDRGRRSFLCAWIPAFPQGGTGDPVCVCRCSSSLKLEEMIESCPLPPTPVPWHAHTPLSSTPQHTPTNIF